MNKGSRKKCFNLIFSHFVKDTSRWITRFYFRIQFPNIQQKKKKRIKKPILEYNLQPHTHNIASVLIFLQYM